MHLLMFDVDGTLVNSLGLEAIYFPRACEEGLGLTGVSSDWGSYRTPSDSGIVAELVERHFEREADSADFAKVEKVFLRLLEEAFTAEPGLCGEIAGARRAFHLARELPATVVGIATAGWTSTAALKLRTAGFELGETILVSSSDGVSKAEILEFGRRRMLARNRMEEFASMTYIGDSIGDADAATRLGFHFIGLDTSGALPSAPHRFESFADHNGFFAAVRHLQGRGRR